MVTEGYKNIKCEIISYTKNPAKIIWDMLKQTWRNLQDVEYNPNNIIVNKFIQESLEKRLNPAPQEALMFQVVFKNISRVCLAQITRQRGWMFNSESQMPQAVKHEIMVPLNIVNSGYYNDVIDLIEQSQKLYDKMTATNDLDNELTDIPYQDARYILIHGQTTAISASFTMPLFIRCANQRLDNNTHDEINYLMRVTMREMRKAINNDKELDELDKHIYNFLLDECDCSGASKKVSTCCDALFGNAFKRYPDANEHVTKATENRLFNYTRLAWYEELKRMYVQEPELLLPNEKEMIERWINEKK